MKKPFAEMLSELSEAQAEFLIVGAYALGAYGFVRATFDFDIWVNPNKENAPKVFAALKSFGAPLGNLKLEELSRPGLIYQVGVAPLRIDIITSVSGLSFRRAWEHKKTRDIEGHKVFVLSLEDIRRNKKSSGRPKDVSDVSWIDAVAKEKRFRAKKRK